jgi:hypothetical protein
MSEPGVHDGDAGLLALLRIRNDAGIGTRRLSSVTTFLISSGYCFAKYIVMSPPIEWPTMVSLS